MKNYPSQGWIQDFWFVCVCVGGGGGQNIMCTHADHEREVPYGRGPALGGGGGVTFLVLSESYF